MAMRRLKNPKYKDWTLKNKKIKLIKHLRKGIEKFREGSNDYPFMGVVAKWLRNGSDLYLLLIGQEHIKHYIHLYIFLKISL